MVRLIPGTVVEQLLGQAAIGVARGDAELPSLLRPRPALCTCSTCGWLGGVLRGDLGVSWLSGKPVIALFLERLPVSAELAVLAVAWSLLLGVPLGTAAAVWRGGFRDGAIRVATTLGLSLPAFWQGTVLILLFSIYLGWMPSLVWVPLMTRSGGEPRDHGAAGADARHGERGHDHAHGAVVDAATCSGASTSAPRARRGWPSAA